VVKIVTKEKTFGSVKRFGVRYGRTVKHNLSKIESELRKKQKCPYCSNFAAKRIASGIWNCRKCGAKFTGKAYSVSKKITVKEKYREEVGSEEIVKKERGEKYSENPKKEDSGGIEEKGGLQ
jgi:large subunit ribosomal protein L37Ae